MRGKRPIQWLWDWLGYGSMGEDYEVLPTIQPVALVDAITWPPSYQFWTVGPAGIINGTVTTLLPAPAADKARLWLQVWVDSTASTAGADYIDRNTQGLSYNLIQQQQPVATLLDYPLIGGHSGQSATGPAIKGHPPLLSFAESPLQHRHVDTVAAGTFTLRGLYIDIPLNGPLPASFL